MPQNLQATKFHQMLKINILTLEDFGVFVSWWQ